MPEIRIVSHRESEPLNLTAFVDLATFALEREDTPDNCEISIAIVSEDEIAQLNEKYRSKQGPTDVLSFPCDDVATIVADDEPIMLGDIIIAPAVAEANAAELGNTIEEELNLLVVHGVLHLLGYDHIEDSDAVVMQERERSLLTAWGIQ